MKIAEYRWQIWSNDSNKAYSGDSVEEWEWDVAEMAHINVGFCQVQTGQDGTDVLPSAPRASESSKRLMKEKVQEAEQIDTVLWTKQSSKVIIEDYKKRMNVWKSFLFISLFPNAI